MNPLQNKIFEIFLAIKEICERNGLRYYALGGTCIGAIRHGGFIPWDDDLDIAMPDVDYEIFLNIASKELPKKYKIIKPGELSHSICLFAKVHDIETTFIEKSELKYKESYKGVFVDILPLCGLPDGKLKRFLHICRVWADIRLYQKTGRDVKTSKGLKGKLTWLLLRPITLLFSRKVWLGRWEKAVFKYRFDDSSKISFLWLPRAGKRIMDKELFRDYEDFSFETSSIRCPKGWDNYLKKSFGDYMTPPPNEKQKSVHGGGIIDLEKSYVFYQSADINNNSQNS